ncbi:MAG: hypothetical protein AABW61_01250 [Candidatus Aenigmatarchaeota archaeon]
MKLKESEILKLIKEGRNTTRELIISMFDFKRSEARTYNPKYSKYYYKLRMKLREMENERLISKVANAGEYEFYVKR